MKTEGRSTDSFAKDMSMRYKLKVGNYRETPVRKNTGAIMQQLRKM